MDDSIVLFYNANKVALFINILTKFYNFFFVSLRLFYLLLIIEDCNYSENIVIIKILLLLHSRALLLTL